MTKYTDEQIKKALDGADVFLRNRANAKPAPLNEYDKEALLDIAKICDEAVDLINRQEAEIDRLKEEQSRALDECINCGIKREIQKRIIAAKSEAIKEFAQRVKEKIYVAHFNMSTKKELAVATIDPDDIDNLVKEMVGESDA